MPLKILTFKVLTVNFFFRNVLLLIGRTGLIYGVPQYFRFLKTISGSRKPRASQNLSTKKSRFEIDDKSSFIYIYIYIYFIYLYLYKSSL